MKKNNSKIKISAVSYLNTKPFIYGIKKCLSQNSYSLQLNTPSVCAQKIISGNSDLGLVPIAAISKIKNPDIISDFCIGADGTVGSVLLFSQVPLNKIEKIQLDYQSKTSIALVQVLAKFFWEITPEWIKAKKGYEKKIKKTTAGVVIGDRTFNLSRKFQYAYDLSAEWKKFTGLSFVFACWVSNKKLPADFVSEFNEALKCGVNNRNKVIEKLNKGKFNSADYLMRKVSYDFDSKKKKAMKQFLKMAKEAVDDF